MRYVDRNSVAAPPSLTDIHGAGMRELARVRLHYLQPDAGSYDFKAYKGDDVVAALRDLFKKKCAYCESNFEAVSPMDIEHYRPKGGVKGDGVHRGYWWLAAAWDNLLASCPECNRERYQHVGMDGMTQRDLDAVRRILSGKKDAFPITGVRACLESDDHALEDPLLIDPTRRDPGLHLVWEELMYADQPSALSIVSPQGGGGIPDPYGDESIAIYGLNRRGLVERRTALMLVLKTEAARLENLMLATAALPDAYLAQFLPIIDEAFRNFRSFAAEDCEYSACARAFIDAASIAIIDRLKELKVRLTATGNTPLGADS